METISSNTLFWEEKSQGFYVNRLRVLDRGRIRLQGGIGPA